MSKDKRSPRILEILRACNRYDYKADAQNIIRILDAVEPRLLRRGDLGGTLLWWAAKVGSIELLDWLITRGVDVNCIDPLYAHQAKRAIEAAASNGHVDAVRYLIEHGSDINWSSEAQGLISPPMQTAVLRNHLPVVKVLVESGALLNALDNNGRTHLDVALMFGHTELAEYLRSMGALESKSLPSATKKPD